MRVGLVCPYSLDVPGGVQNHVKDLAEALIGLGHEVSVLAPSENEAALPSYVVPTGGAVRVPYNGSVARVSFGPVVASRVRRWLREGSFDVLHLHEPATPSISVLALWAADCPVVATFHTSNIRSRAMSASASILRPSFEKITARIAVSESARSTLVQHLGGEPVVIPNGVYVDRYATAQVRDDWRGEGPTLVESVTYRLHPTFPKPVLRITDASTKFRLEPPSVARSSTIVRWNKRFWLVRWNTSSFSSSTAMNGSKAFRLSPSR
mgnify:CR=1 FL=1